MRSPHANSNGYEMISYFILIRISEPLEFTGTCPGAIMTRFLKSKNDQKSELSIRIILVNSKHGS
jgi:hypothetical protein